MFAKQKYLRSFSRRNKLFDSFQTFIVVCTRSICFFKLLIIWTHKGANNSFKFILLWKFDLIRVINVNSNLINIKIHCFACEINKFSICMTIVKNNKLNNLSEVYEN